MRIATKAESMRLLAAGRLGNKIPSWATPEAAAAAGYAGTVMVRSRVPNSPHMRPNVRLADAAATIAGLVAAGARRDDLYLTAMTPEVGRRLNAELWDGPAGLDLHYATVQAHLREALATAGRHARGSAARRVLAWACDPSSLDDLEILMATYPGAVIELTAYDRNIGDVPGRNTVIWEVRHY